MQNTTTQTARATNESSLRVLSQVLVGRLENQKHIVFDSKNRTMLRDELFRSLRPLVVTEQDLVSMAREAILSRTQDIADQNIAESEAFRMKKKDFKEKYADHEIAGFYLKVPLREVVRKVCEFLFSCDLVEDVFESDEVIQKLVQDSISTFDESKVAS